jgi:hypothetical protein
MFPSQHIEDSQDPYAEFAPDRPESDEDSHGEHKAAADALATEEAGEEEAATVDLGRSAPHGSLRDWTDENDEESVGEGGVVSWQLVAGSEVRRKAAAECPGASGSRLQG